MAKDSSLGGGAGQFAFDLESQAGVTHLLASLRASEIDPEQKNELRDLVFLYTNGGRDQSVRNTLEQKIQAYNVAPLAAQAKPAAEELPANQSAYPFGTSRPSPSFPVAVAQPDKVEETAPVSSAPAPAPAPAPAHVSSPVSTPKPEPAPVVAPAPAPTPAPQPEPEPVVVPEPTPAPAAPPTPTPAPQPAPVAPVPAPEPAPAPVPSTPQIPPSPPAPAPASAPGYDPNQSLQRIREIKSLVNDKVGNPVNLVDIDNEVGREYMGALLDAMKKLNNGTSALSAMKRLEEAYVKVEKTLEEHEMKKGDAPEMPPEEEKVLPPPTPIPAEETPAETTPIEEKKVTPPPPVQEESAEVPTPSPKPEPRKQPVEPKEPKDIPPVEPNKPTPPRKPFEVPSVPQVEIEKKPAPESGKAKEPTNLPVKEPISDIPVPVPSPAKKPAPEKPKTVAAKEGSETPTAWGSETDSVPINRSDKVTSEPSSKVASLADSKTKLRTPSDLPEASAIETSSVEGDPLFTKEVDDGLQQLLSEWSLFKKSGLFGTGPKGREHPLFLKVAGLQIPLLLAGRFEGATQEVKQSITDYMNGWRYEQGIIYVQGETFEHYLRRVIRHILDLQKRKIPQ